MTRKNLLTLTALALLTGNIFAAQVTQYLKLSVTENSNVTAQQSFSMMYAFSLSGTDGLDANDAGNQNAIGNPGNDVYPFSLSSNGDIITQQDARAGLCGYKKVKMGFISKFPATIKVVASAFGNTSDVTDRPTYAWIEQISTGNIYYFFGDTAKINIPANLNYAADFYLHTGPFIKSGQTNVTCFGALDGDVTVENPNCNNWSLNLYKNSILVSSDSVFQPTMTISNLTTGTYTLITSINSIHVDSTVVVITSAPQIIADFSVDNYTPTTDIAVNFTDASVAGQSDSYAWSFGDGNSNTQTSTSYQYAVAGTYQVMLTITSATGCHATKFDTVHVSQGFTISSSFNQMMNNHNMNTVDESSTPATVLSFEIFGGEGQRIMFTQNEPQAVNVTIINASGQVIASTQTADAKFELPVPSNGIYIVSITNAKNEVQTKTIMVTN